MTLGLNESAPTTLPQLIPLGLQVHIVGGIQTIEVAPTMCENGSTPPKTHAVAAIGVFGTGTRAENPIATSQMPALTPWLVIAGRSLQHPPEFRIPSENIDG